MIENRTGLKTHYQCNLCGNTTARTRFYVCGKPIVRCNSCRLVRYEPLPSEDELAQLYDNETYFESEYFAFDDERWQTTHYKHFLRVARLAREHCGRDGKLLEIGPGQGMFLKRCLEYEINAEGIEFSAREAARLDSQLDCPVYQGRLQDVLLEPESYAMVAAFDVIEHCRDPKHWLQRIHSILKPGGLLALSTISIANLLDRLGAFLYRIGLRQAVEKLYPPYHLYYFAPETLMRYLESCGFSIIELIQENYDPRKATSNTVEQVALRCLYLWHDISGHKTNQYVLAQKH